MVEEESERSEPGKSLQAYLLQLSLNLLSVRVSALRCWICLSFAIASHQCPTTAHLGKSLRDECFECWRPRGSSGHGIGPTAACCCHAGLVGSIACRVVDVSNGARSTCIADRAGSLTMAAACLSPNGLPSNCIEVHYSKC